MDPNLSLPTMSEQPSTSIPPDPNTAPNATSKKTTKKSKAKKPNDSKLTGDELCTICGDPANGFNYGVLSCEGCKAFYRRCVNNLKKGGDSKQYKCKFNNDCNLFKVTKQRG